MHLGRNLFLILLSCSLLSFSSSQYKNEESKVWTDNERIDCYPEGNVTLELCEARNCVWNFIENNGTTSPHDPEYPDVRYPIHVGFPPCYYQGPPFPQGYVKVSQIETTAGYSIILNRTTPSFYVKDVNILKIDVFFETEHRIRVKISDPNNERYEVPIPTRPTISIASPKTLYNFKFIEPCYFQIIRNSTGEVIFDTSFGPFIFSDQYLQISSKVPTEYLYGLGLSNDRLSRSFNWQIIPIFNSLLNPDYGTHPFYLALENSTNSHGVLLFNSNGMDILLQPSPAITYRVIGGILDFYFFLGPTSDDVVSQYNELVGRPFFPPYWSFGFHLSRYNYASLNATREVWQRTRDANIPYDVQWNDIDYMDNYKSFTYNKVAFDGLPEFVNELHSVNMKYVAIIDAGTSTEGGPTGDYLTYTEGISEDIFIKDQQGQYISGQVWPLDAVFTDFTKPESLDYWRRQYERLLLQVPMDGAWVDMNEPTTFTAGTQNNTCPASNWDFPPYTPAVELGDLWARSICMSSVQVGGVHYNLHNLYGYMMAIATKHAMESFWDKRPFVLSRSSFIGHGHYGALWTGDVYSSWKDFDLTIPGLLTYNLLGVTMTGADICGFRRNTTLELCQRWTQLGAFYPFARNHNENNNLDQDPAFLGPNMVNTTIESITLRYLYLPYIYTQMYFAHKDGTTAIKPLFFEFPSDSVTYKIDRQFLWGKEILVIPILEQGKTNVDAYFPAGRWALPNEFLVTNGEWKNVDIPLLGPGFYALRGGYVVPWQEPALTTFDSRKNPFGITATLDENGNADGRLFWDDGETNAYTLNDIYNQIRFSVIQNKLVSSVEHFGYISEGGMVLGTIKIHGLDPEPNSLTVDGITVPFQYSALTKTLVISNLSLDLSNAFIVEWM